MATITTFATLQTAMTEWLARDQDATLIARQPTFIQFFEASMNRTLFVRQMEARSTTTTGASTGFTGLVTINNPSGSTTGTAVTAVDESTTIPNGTTVSKIGIYQTTAKTVTLKVAKKNSPGNYDIVVSQSFSHPGGGWSDAILTTAYVIPSSGSYYLAAWSSGTSDTVAGTVTGAYVLTTDVTGAGQSFTENPAGGTWALRYYAGSLTEPEMISLPTDFQSMRRVRLSSVTGKPYLSFKSGTQMDELRLSEANVTAQPKYFTIFGTEMELLPTPDSNYTIEMVYRANIPALGVAQTGNWLLDLAPDLYLYGSLLHSAPYIKEDGRLQTWGAAFSTALSDLNMLGMTSTFNAGPMQMTPSGVTP